MDGLVHSLRLGTLRGTGRQLEPDRPFVLAGVEWATPRQARIELRARSEGRWTPWTRVSVQGHDSDGGESAAHAHFGEPVWTGTATELQLRSDRIVTGLSVHLVAADVLSQLDVRPAVTSSAGTTEMDVRPAVTSSARTTRFAPAEPILPAGPGQPAIIARRAWAGTRGPASPPVYGDVRMMFVHHSVNANGYSAGEVPGMLLSIYEFHRYVRGWNDIGYNFVVDAYGRIWEARAGGIDQAVVGAHAGGYNLESSGVVMLGTFSGALPTPAALASLERLLAWKLSLHGVPVSGSVTVEVDPSDAFYTAFRPGQHVTLPRIAGHRDGCTTDCPGAVLYGHLPVVRANVRRLVRTQVALTCEFAPGQRAVAARSLSLAVAEVTAGQPVSVLGRLTQQSFDGAAGAPVSNATLEIQSLVGQAEGVPPGLELGADGPFVLSTEPDGQFHAQFSPHHNVLVRALRSDTQAVASPLLAVAVAPAVTLTVDPDAGPGAAPALSGTVTPYKPMIDVVARRAGHPHAPAHTQAVAVGSDGTFHFRLKLKSGAYLIRAVTRADADNVVGKSPDISLTV